MTFYNQILKHMYSKRRVCLCQMSSGSLIFLAVQGLRCCAWVFSSCDARASHYSVFSLVAEHGLYGMQASRTTSCMG